VGANVAVAQASVADSTRPERRARGMGLIGASFGLAFIVGPALGGFLSRWGYALPGFVAAGLSAANALLAWFLLPESLPAANRNRGSIATALLVDRWAHARRVLGRRDLFEPIVALSLGTVAFAAFTTTFPLFLKQGLGLGAEAAGGMFALLGLVTAVSQGRLIGPLVERSGERRVAVRGAVLMAAALAAFAWFTGVWATLILLVPFGLGWGMLAPSLQSLTSRRAGHQEQGEVLGVNQSVGSMARVLGPIAGGWMFGALGFKWEFAASGALVFAAAAWVLRMRPGAEA
jgi:predicted MFS family arabinose efflux permease